MVQAQYGKEGFKFNNIEESEYTGGGGAQGAGGFGGGKEKRGGVGGKASKSNNAKEMKKANQRRNEKREREEAKEQAVQRSEWVAAETKKWTPVDRADARHQQKVQATSNKKATKAAKAAQKAADNEDY